MGKKPEEISLRDAAELLGVSKRRVQAIVDAGNLEVSSVVQAGGVRVHMLRRADVVAYKPRIQGEPGRPPKQPG